MYASSLQLLHNARVAMTHAFFVLENLLQAADNRVYSSVLSEVAAEWRKDMYDSFSDGVVLANKLAGERQNVPPEDVVLFVKKDSLRSFPGYRRKLENITKDGYVARIRHYDIPPDTVSGIASGLDQILKNAMSLDVVSSRCELERAKNECAATLDDLYDEDIHLT